MIGLWLWASFAMTQAPIMPAVPDTIPFTELARVRPSEPDECGLDIGEGNRLDLMIHLSADRTIGYEILVFRSRRPLELSPGTNLEQQSWSGRHHARFTSAGGGQQIVVIDAKALPALWYEEYLLFAAADRPQSEERIVVSLEGTARFQGRDMSARQALGEMLACHEEAGI
jgi:hypothetical protein